MVDSGPITTLSQHTHSSALRSIRALSLHYQRGIGRQSLPITRLTQLVGRSTSSLSLSKLYEHFFLCSHGSVYYVFGRRPPSRSPSLASSVYRIPLVRRVHLHWSRDEGACEACGRARGNDRRSCSPKAPFYIAGPGILN